MQPRFEILEEKKLVGKRLSMSYANNRTVELWQSFMPHRKEITNNLNSNLLSLQIYDPSFSFTQFNPHKTFEKWAVAEVSDFSNVPSGMETLVLPGGQYAIFLHRGPVSEGSKTAQYIFAEWLPNSGYEIDYRPHFELLTEKYKHNEPDSEEEFWIPVRKKGKHVFLPY